MSTKPSLYRRRMLALANGGHVRGPGSGTSDSIPARLSDGEFVLPADTVRKVGVKSLRDLVDVTHKPSGKPTHPARFADGGVVDLTNRYSRSRTGFDADGWAQQQLQEQSQRTHDALAAGEVAQQQAAAAPAAKPSPTASQQGAPAPGTQGADLVAAEAAKAQSRAATGMAIKDAVSSAGQAVVDAAKAPFGKGSSPAAPMLTAPSAPTAPATTNTNPTDMRLAAGTQTSPAPGPASRPKPDAPEVPNPTPAQGREVAPDVYNHGRGQYSDDPSGMGMPAGFTGQPSAANNAILERMSDQSKAESMARLGFGPQAQYAAEVQRAKNINADEAARNNSVGARMQRLSDPFSIEGRAMRNLQMDIDSSVDRKGRPTGETQALLEKQKAMVGGYIAEPAQQATIAGSLQREGMQQAGETQRTDIRAGLEQQKINQADAELGLKREAAGFQNRTAKRMEKAQVDLESAKTPEEQRSARERLLALAGKSVHESARDRYLTVGGGQSVRDGQTVKDPTQVYDTQAQRWLQPPEQGAAPAVPSSKDALVRGQVYQTARGPARWDGGQFQSMR